MNLSPQSLDIRGYQPIAPVQQRGPVATCLVKSDESERNFVAESLELSDGAAVLFSRLRRQWQANVRRQPKGSLRQKALQVGEQRLTRIIALPQGRPLNESLFVRRYRWADAVDAAIQLTACLIDWHKSQRVHGGLTGECIFRGRDGRIELRDGVYFDVCAQHELLALPVGEVALLAPEASGSLSREVSAASDLYSVGAMLFGMLSGRTPLTALTASEYLDRQLCVEPPRLRSLGVKVPQLLDDLVARLLRRDPRDRYETATGLLFDLKQIVRSGDEPQEARPLAVGTRDVRRKLTEAGLVGREVELQAVQRAMHRAGSGQSSVQAITGGERSCRRSLVDEIALRAKAQGMYTFRGAASIANNPRPLQSLEPVLTAILRLCNDDHELAKRIAAATREHAATLVSLVPELSRLWPTRDDHAGPDAFGSQRAAIALEELFFAFAKEPQGGAFFFDDLDIADEMTRAVVRSLAERSEQETGAVFFCVVTGESPQSLNCSSHLLPLRLRPLSAEALETHLLSTAGPLAEPIRQLIVEVADGSVVMASAMLGRMVDTGVIKPTPEGWVADGLLRKSLREDLTCAELLQRQVSTLPSAALQILSAAAVVGQSFRLGMLTAITKAPYEEVLEVATEALGRRLLWRDEQGDAYQFAHDQIHQQLCSSLNPGQRRRLHLSCAAYLEEHDPTNVFDLAVHYDAAGKGELALPNALQAAREARQRFSLAVARDHLEIAKRWLVGGDQKVAFEVSEGLGEIHLLTGRYEQAAVDLGEARQLARGPLEKARVQQLIGELSFKRGRFAEAAKMFEDALAVAGVRLPNNLFTMCTGVLVQAGVQAVHSALPARWVGRRGDPSELDCLRLQILSRLSRVYWFSRHRLWTLGNHLRSLNEAERFAPTPMLAALYSEHAPVMSLLRRFTRANRFAERSLAIRKQLGDLWGQGQTHHYHCVVMLAECRFQDAIDMSLRANSLLKQTGDLWEMNMARYQTANALYRIGRLSDAAEMAAQMFSSGREIGDVQASGISLDVWARAAPHSLPLETVTQEASRFRHDAQSHAQTQLGYAVVLLHHGRTDEAVEALREAIDRCREAGHMNTYISPCYAWLATALRHRAEEIDVRDGRRLRNCVLVARRAARRAIRLARRFPADRAHAWRELAVLQGMMGQTRRCVRSLHRSLAAARRYLQPIEELETLTVLQLLHQREAERLGPMPTALNVRLAELHELDAACCGRDSASAADATGLSLADRFVNVLKSGRRIAKALSADAVYAEASEAARRLLHGQHVDVVLVREVTDRLLLEPWRAEEADETRRMRVSEHEQVVEAAIRKGQASVAEASEDPLGAKRGSAAAAPILFRGQAVAAILVTHDELNDLFGQDELRIADFVSTLAGAALENADGFLRLQQMNETLEQRVQERTKAAEERAHQLAKSNEQLRAAEEQLRRAIVAANSANEAKSRFLATISHEIRTPLNGLLGMTQLARQAAHDERQSGYLENAQESGESLLNLINDLLDFSKLEAGKMELERIPFDPRQLCGEVARLLGTSALRKGIALQCEVQPAVPQWVVGDPARLRQVIVNLVGNALKFTEQGFVRLSIETVQEDGARPSLAITVRDSGIGIPADKLDRIFESFSQVDSSTTRRYGGTGLGLAICRELVERMQGTVQVESEPGAGSTFTVTLPLEVADPPPETRTCSPRQAFSDHASEKASPPVQDVSRREEAADADRDGALRILVAEDGPINQEVIAGILEMLGHRVVLASDGEAAVQHAASGAFDLCFMDVDMPKLDGVEATREIRQAEAADQRSRLPIIAMTAHSGDRIGEACERAGMDGHLAKPVQPVALSELLHGFVARRTDATVSTADASRHCADPLAGASS